MRYLILLISLSFIGCYSNEGSNNNNEVVTNDNKDAQRNDIETNEFLFLGFDSYMNSEEFENQIQIENDLGNLNGNQFELPLSNCRGCSVSFSVSQMKHSISLIYNSPVQIKNNYTVLSSDHEVEVENYYLKVDGMNEILNQKYTSIDNSDFIKTVLPFFQEYSVSGSVTHYNLYESDSKVILLRSTYTSTLREGINALKESNAYIEKLGESDPTSRNYTVYGLLKNQIESNLERIEALEKSTIKTHKFSHTIGLDYFFKEEYHDMVEIVKMKKDSIFQHNLNLYPTTPNNEKLEQEIKSKIQDKI